jgi:hypothetical protein
VLAKTTISLKGSTKERNHRSGPYGFSEYLESFHPLHERRCALRFLIMVPRLLARGAARSLLQALGRGSQFSARAAATCAPQVLDRGAQAVGCGVTALV